MYKKFWWDQSKFPIPFMEGNGRSFQVPKWDFKCWKRQYPMEGVSNVFQCGSHEIVNESLFGNWHAIVLYNYI